jgi:enoyl-CoA hydratase/carnithine racemase
MPVLIEKRRKTAILTLSRPAARNAWGEDFDEELTALLKSLARDKEIHSVILTGDDSGGAFSAGANLADNNTHAAPPPGEFIEELDKARRFVSIVLAEFPKPIIAAVNGYAIGVGCIATFSCDLIVACDRSEWRLPQVRLGILPAYAGAVRLARWIGKGHAMRLSLGFPLSGEEAFRIGLAQWLVPHKDLLDKAMEVADHLGELAPLSLRMTKESIDRGMDLPNVADAALVDAYRMQILQQTHDAQEAHTAWRGGRRRPEFNGS